MRPQAIDWAAVMRQIRAVQPTMSLDEISTRLQLSKGTVVNLLTGAHEPLHTNGERVLLLWIERTGQTREQIPVHDDLVRTLTA